MASRIPGAAVQQPGGSCGCTTRRGTCAGLDHLQRPRYFAGQLLTEAELNTEQAYVRAHNRLHNRYLHGPGVVCGLQVVCHECPGWVTVTPGYAIDPCGNDLIVCAPHDFNVIKAIAECRAARRRQRHVECLPPEPPKNARCKEEDEHWCLRICYQEQEARPITVLRRTAVAACGCNGGGNNTATRSACSGPAQLGTACEPTRIIESYRLDVVETPPDRVVGQVSAGWMWELLKGMEHTLVGRAVQCFLPAASVLIGRLGKRVLGQFVRVAAIATFQVKRQEFGLWQLPTAQEQYQSSLLVQRALIAQFAQSTLRVNCELLRELEQIQFVHPAPQDTAADYLDMKARAPAAHLGSLMLWALRDCFCEALLPPCPEDPADDCLTLACLTIRGDRILHICNFSGRRYAGGFPALYYWFSFGPVLRGLLELGCCPAWWTDMLRYVEHQLVRPDGTPGHTQFINQMATADFALPRAALANIRSIFSTTTLTGMLDRTLLKSVNVPALLGHPAADVERACHERGVKTIVRTVASRDEIPLPARRRAFTPPVAFEDDTVILFKTPDDQVVGWARREAEDELNEARAELRGLREELTTLRATVETLLPHG